VLSDALKDAIGEYRIQLLTASVPDDESQRAREGLAQSDLQEVTIFAFAQTARGILQWLWATRPANTKQVQGRMSGLLQERSQCLLPLTVGGT
jgi:hypothetical protein